MNLIESAIAGILVITLLIASLYDLKYREIPRAVWLGTWFVMPLALMQLALLSVDNLPTAIMNAMILGAVVVVSFFLHEFGRLNTGDVIGLIVVFTCLSFGVYPLYMLFYVGLWLIIAAALVMLAGKSAWRIPFIVPLTMGVISALSLYRA